MFSMIRAMYSTNPRILLYPPGAPVPPHPLNHRMFYELSVCFALPHTMPVIDHVVLGAAEDMAHSSLRFGIGRFTTEAEIDFVVDKIVAVVQRLRDMRYEISFILINFIDDGVAAPFGRWFRKASTSIPSTGRNISFGLFRHTVFLWLSRVLAHPLWFTYADLHDLVCILEKPLPIVLPTVNCNVSSS